MRTTLKKRTNLSEAKVVWAVTILVMGASAAFADDWPIYRGPNHNGFSGETNWKADWGSAGPKKLWTKSIGVGFSSITVADQRAYMTGNSGEKSDAKDTIFCVDANTGKEIWTRSYDCPLEPKYYEGGTLASPTVDGKVVYTISKMGDLFALDAVTGDVLWSKNVHKEYGFELPTWHFAGSPLPAGNLLIFNLGTAGAALNKKTGQLLWDNGKGPCGYATPVPCTIDGQDCLAIFASDSVKGVNTTDGKILWQHPFGNSEKVNAADPIISGNSVFLSCGYNRGCAKITITGGKVTEDWDSKVIRNHINCSMLWNGFIYGFDESKLKCIDLKTGTQQWAEDSLGKGSLMMTTDGRMIIMSDKGELVIAHATPNEFKAVARAQILPKSKSWTTPTLSNGKIYARNAKGDVVCVDVSG